MNDHREARCYRLPLIVRPRSVKLDSGHWRETVECQRCGAWLPLGPSDESASAVAVEAIAARLAVDPLKATAPQLVGWRGDDDAGPFVMDGKAYQEGYLARVIYDHDAEQAEERSVLP